jgi:hypothetical protein
MKLRTSQEVLDAIDGEVAWRTKEMANVCVAVRDARDTFSGNLSRAAFPLIYAHWEGGVKRCASYYLEYVARQRHSYSELRSNFIAISCASSIQQAAASGQLHVYAQVVDFLLFNQFDRYQKPSSFEIQTESNLSSKVMDNICFNVGVSLGDDFEINRNFIDRSLVSTRNKIAHGVFEEISEKFLIEAKDKVLFLLGIFTTELQNSIVLKKYLR